MNAFPHGLYESLVTEALATRLETLPDDRQPRTDALRTAEAADRIAWHIASVVERAIEMLPESQRTAAGVELARSLVDRVVEGTNVGELADQRPSDPADVLRAVHRLRPDGSPAPIDVPLIPLLDSALLTNSPGEPATNWVGFAHRMVIGLAFAAIAAFAPREAAKHGERERRYRKAELEIASVGPFLVSLPQTEQNAIRKEFADRVFGREVGAPTITELPASTNGLVDTLQLVVRELLNIAKTK